MSRRWRLAPRPPGTTLSRDGRPRPRHRGLLRTLSFGRLRLRVERPVDADVARRRRAGVAAVSRAANLDLVAAVLLGHFGDALPDGAVESEGADVVQAVRIRRGRLRHRPALLLAVAGCRRRARDLRLGVRRPRQAALALGLGPLRRGPRAVGRREVALLEVLEIDVAWFGLGVVAPEAGAGEAEA